MVRWTGCLWWSSLTRSWWRSVKTKWAKTPFHVVMTVTANGERDILGIWAGDGAEGARLWLQVLGTVRSTV